MLIITKEKDERIILAQGVNGYEILLTSLVPNTFGAYLVFQGMRLFHAW